MRLAFRANAVVRDDMVPHVVDDEVLVLAKRRIEVKRRRLAQRSLAANGAVRRHDDGPGQRAGRHLAIERGNDAQEARLVLCQAVQPDDQGVALLRIVTRRNVHVQVALLAECRGMDPQVVAMIPSEVVDLTHQLLVQPIEVNGGIAAALADRQQVRRNQQYEQGRKREMQSRQTPGGKTAGMDARPCER